MELCGIMRGDLYHCRFTRDKERPRPAEGSTTTSSRTRVRFNFDVHIKFQSFDEYAIFNVDIIGKLRNF